MKSIRLLVMSCLLLAFVPGSRAAEPGHAQILAHNVFAPFGAPGIASRLDLIARHDYIAGHDVVILTELFNDPASTRLLESLRAEYPYQTPVLGRGDPVDSACASNACWNNVEGAIGPNQVEDGGVAILSKWPIVDRRAYIFGATCGVDALSRKGLVYVALAINGARVHVVGTHLQADGCGVGETRLPIEALFVCRAPDITVETSRCPAAWDTPYEAVRLAQFMEIDAWITAQAIPRDDMVVIGGDLNVDKEHNPAEYDRMRCWLRAQEPIFGGSPDLDPPWYTWDSAKNALLDSQVGRQYLDYIFVRADHAHPAVWRNVVLRPTASPDNWSDGAARGNELSDHFPVVGFADTPDS